MAKAEEVEGDTAADAEDYFGNVTINLDTGDSGGDELVGDINITVFNGSGEDIDNAVTTITTLMYTICGVVLIVLLVPIILAVVWIISKWREGKYYKCMADGSCGTKKSNKKKKK